MSRRSPVTPAGHGELLTEPPVQDWAGLARETASIASGWAFEICGVRAPELRNRARAEAIVLAREFSSRLHVPLALVDDQPDLLVMTGHQPELYHPGIWVKDFLLQRIAEETGAAAIDIVVDSDGFNALEVHSPCMRPEARVCRAYLAIGAEDACYACTPVPSREDIGTFVAAVTENLSTLAAPAILHHFTTFAAGLADAVQDAQDLAELVTFARRRYEAVAGTDYLELPVTLQAQGHAFAAFVADIALNASEFAGAYNEELAEYRARTGTRSAAQPFPDLSIDGRRIELPIWVLDGGMRTTVWADLSDGCRLVTHDTELVRLPEACADAPDAVRASGHRFAPKALALTLFERLFVADLFIHGTGGGRYDRVTDGVMRRYYGIEPPPFAVASLTMYLPLGARVVSEGEIDELVQRLNRLRQNPDQILSDVEFEHAEERRRADALASEKADLVTRIAAEGADKKELGARIREVNATLAEMLAPQARELEEELEELKRLREASEVLTDRTYPLCFWNPGEVADKIR